MEATSNRSPKQVHFSNSSQLFIFQATGDVSSKFYASEEKMNLQIQVLWETHIGRGQW